MAKRPPSTVPGPAGDAAGSQGPGTSTSRGTPSYGRTLRNRPFFLLWVAQLISQSGDYIFDVALIWLVLEITHSALDVGVVVTGAILPNVVLGPFLGVYVDRWNRRNTLIFTNVGQGAVVAVLAVFVAAGKATLPLLFLIVVVLGVGNMLVRTSTNAYVPSVVPTDDLPPANGLLTLSGSMNQIVGLSIGGAVVALLGVTVPMEYDAISFFGAALLLMLITQASGRSADSAARGTPHFKEELAEGFRFIRQNRFLLEIIVIGVLVNFFGNGVFALFAPYTEFTLHSTVVVYGLLGAFVALGSLVGAAVMGKRNLRSSAGKYLFAGAITLGPMLVVLGLFASVPLALTLMLLFGVALTITNLPITVAMQAKVPGRLLGRVGAAFSALVLASGPAGPLVAGWFAETWSASAFFLLSGIVITIVIAVGAVTMTSLRTIQY